MKNPTVLTNSDKSYFSELLAVLNEADSSTSISSNSENGNTEIKITKASQNNTVDNGKDLKDKKVDNDPALDNDTGEEELNPDTEFLDNSLMVPDPPEEKLEPDGLKKKRLAILFQKLLRDLNVFIEIIDKTNLNLLTAQNVQLFNLMITQLTNLKQNISDYILKSINSDSYPEMLYKYLLFRNELVLNIKILNQINSQDNQTNKNNK